MTNYVHKAEQAKKKETVNENYIKAIKALLERQRELPIYMAKALEQELERLVENE